MLCFAVGPKEFRYRSRSARDIQAEGTIMLWGRFGSKGISIVY